MHGWGLFAGQPIPQDTFVIEYVGEVVDNVIAGGWGWKV
jgi:SET domain-containing protein